MIGGHATVARASDPPELDGVRHEYINAGGLRTHVALAGPEDAPPILLAHGWPQNWWAWRHVIPALAERHRVIAPDLRGHGWSEAPRWGYEKEQLASDLLSVLDALGLERVVWIGHDWGGWSGFLAALRAPERIERMLVLCVPPLWTKPHPRQAAMLAYQVPISLPLLGKSLAVRVSRALLQTGRRGEALPAREVAIFAESIPPAVTVSMYRTFLTRELLPIARGRYEESVLAVPTTLIVGSRDLVTREVVAGPVAGQPELHAEIEEGVAHWLHEQRPQAILDWAGRA